MTDRQNAAMKFKGRVWMVGDNINTDLILPNKAFYLTHEEQAQYVFHANRPGWAQQVQKGDILIGGHNFGMGSSRAAARSLKNLGLACLTEPIDGLNGVFKSVFPVSLYTTYTHPLWKLRTDTRIGTNWRCSTLPIRPITKTSTD